MATRIKQSLLAVNWLGLVAIIGILAVWQILVSTKIIDYAPLPGPIDIWSGFKYLAGSEGGLWSALGHTMKSVFIGWVIAVLVGGVVGLLVALNATVASWANSTVDLLRSLPVIALIPIAILIWGTGIKTEIILGAYAGMWPMLMNTAGGARNVSPRLREVAQTMGLSRLQTLFKVIIPSAAQSMLVGARLALSTTLVICVVAEILGLQAGIGNQLVLEEQGFEPSRYWAYVLLIGLLGILLNFLLVRIVRILFPGVTAAAERSAA